MSNSLSIFLTNYILSLLERTRKEKAGIKFGFDWIIYNLGLVKDWIPIRLPFIRQPQEEAVKIKTEAEFGEDICFLTPDKGELLIFVLKDEVLNNQNWIPKNFDADIRKAAAPDLSHTELSSIESVKVILAYNKDEDKNGIELFDRLISTMPSKIKNDISLSFERWNVTKLVEEVKEHLFTPDLLPQHLAGLFTYIYSQVSDFSFSTKEWEDQLIPNWKNFLNLLIDDPIDERKLRLLPITLFILYENRKKTPDADPGWIDLIEWAMLYMWDKFKKTDNGDFKKIIVEIWQALYIAELERYFVENSAALLTEHGIHSRKRSLRLTPINDAFIAFWHLGRLGILNIAPQQFFDADVVEEAQLLQEWIKRSSDWLISCLRLNPSTLRPLIDLHHIELFLIWETLWQAGRKDEIYAWLSRLETYLIVRRSGQSHIPFIESRNRFDLVIEYVTLNAPPSEYTEKSSYLLLMLLELCLSLDDKYREELLNRYFNRIVRGIGDDGKSFSDFEIDLIGWVPPVDWSQRVLKESVQDGIAIATGNFDGIQKEDTPLSDRVRNYISKTREKFPFQLPTDIPLVVYVLACIKNRSPLPSEFWREYILPTEK